MHFRYDYGSNSYDNINLYDGKTCELIPVGNLSRCTSKFKTCEQATTEEECKLVAKIGVTDPERKICDWYIPSGLDTGSCIENYKYCSDYRGNNDNDEKIQLNAHLSMII